MDPQIGTIMRINQRTASVECEDGHCWRFRMACSAGWWNPDVSRFSRQSADSFRSCHYKSRYSLALGPVQAIQVKPISTSTAIRKKNGPTHYRRAFQLNVIACCVHLAPRCTRCSPNAAVSCKLIVLAVG